MDAQPWTMEELPVEACLDLLAGARLGRLAFVVDGEPEIRPLNHLLHEGAVVVRMDLGATIDLLADRPTVVYEVDGVEDDGRLAWSVLVRGRADDVADPDELARLRALPLAPWAPGERAHFLRVSPSAITGRRIVREPGPPSAGSGPDGSAVPARAGGG